MLWNKGLSSPLFFGACIHDNVQELIDMRNQADKQREEENMPVADASGANEKVEKERDQLLEL